MLFMGAGIRVVLYKRYAGDSVASCFAPTRNLLWFCQAQNAVLGFVSRKHFRWVAILRLAV